MTRASTSHRRSRSSTGSTPAIGPVVTIQSGAGMGRREVGGPHPDVGPQLRRSGGWPSAPGSRRRSASWRWSAAAMTVCHAPSHALSRVGCGRCLGPPGARAAGPPAGSARRPSSSSPAATMRESAVRIVPPAMPNSSASATRARAGSTGGCEPSRTDSASDRASSGRAEPPDVDCHDLCSQRSEMVTVISDGM